MLDVGKRVRLVRTEAVVTGVTARVCALLDSSADCARTVSKSVWISVLSPGSGVFESLCVQCVPRAVSVWAVSSDVCVRMEDAVIL